MPAIHLLLTDVMNWFSGGLFETRDKTQEMAFRYAVEMINNEKYPLLPNTTLIPCAEYVPQYDSFQVARTGIYVLKLIHIYYVKNILASRWFKRLWS